MGKGRDGSKQRYWRRLIRRQKASGNSVTQFCAGAGVPVHQFYWWQRTLRDRDRLSPVRPREDEHAAARQGKGGASSFVPVRLAFSHGAPLELVHPGGWVVRVPVEFDAPSLRRLLATLTADLTETPED